MLDDRKSAILKALVQQYIETAQPVGSGHIVDHSDIGVSSATVRNEMTTLEKEGYITQPHTSAGRIPTEKGYRTFVDMLGDPSGLGPVQTRQVRSFFAHAHGELEQMLKETSGLLSRLTATPAVVVGETTETAVVRSVQLVALGTRTFLVVVVMSNGLVFKRSVEADLDVDVDDLAAADAALTAAAIDRPVVEVSAVPPTGRPEVDRLAADALGALVSEAEAGRRVYVEGTSQLADAFDATSQLREILGLLEQQLTLVALLDDVLSRGLTVAIGSETGVAPLADCSVVVAPLQVGGEPAGAIGVLGPTRMNYAETLAAVAAVAQRLNRTLTEG